jgi:ATP-dependent helicase/nuclease subunit B
MILTKNKNYQLTINELINSEKFADKVESVLIIVPTNRKLRDLKKQVIDKFKDFPITQINIETFTTLSTKLLKTQKPFSTLSEAASTVLIKETCDELELKYFAAYTNGIPFGTLDKIKNVISEYKRNGISPGKLLEESEKLEGGEKTKAEDLASIYKSYLAKCKKLNALELGDIYFELSLTNEKLFNDAFKNIFPNIQTILIDGFDEFTNLEIILIEKLSGSVNSNISINFDYFENNENLFSHLSQIYFRLVQQGFSEDTISNFDDNSPFRKKLRNELFNKVENKESDFKENIVKINSKNRIDEIETIAKIAKELIVIKKVAPENICVVFNIVGNYSSKVRDIFGKFGLPINLTDRIPLKSSPPVIAAISLLELIETDYHYDDIARVVTNGFLKFENVDLNNLLRVASELKITVGRNNWEQVILDNIQLIKFRENLDENDGKEILKKYKKALDDIHKIDKILSSLKRKNTINEFLQTFTKVLLNLKLPCIVLENSNNREEEHIKAITVLLKTLKEVLYLVQNDEENINEKYPLSFYLDQIRTISNWARFNVKEKSDYGILVTSLNEIRGLKFEYLFLGGMCDGDFPTKYSPEIFFSGSFRKQEIIHQTEEKYHFYQTLCAWNKSLFLSIPKNDKDSELVESMFIKDFEEVFELTEYKNEGISKIYSCEELLIEYGNNPKNVELSEQVKKANFNLEEISNKNKIRDLRKKNYLNQNCFNGFVNSEDENISIFLNKFSNREFSISQFETFAKCPFKYFAERVLKIKPIEEPTEEAEPLELGSVLHSILYEFYSKVTEEKISIGKEGTKEFKVLKNLLFEIAEKKISDLNLNSPLTFFEKEKILGIEGNKELSILYKFLLEETEENSGFIPKYFEYSFGNIPRKNNSKSEKPFEIDNLKLRGTIDRIDVDEENSFFNIVDYKLKGKKPSVTELEEGLSLQLPVYLMAGKQIIKEEKDKDFEAHEMIIYSLNFKDEKFGKSPVNLKVRGKSNPEEKIELNNRILENSKSKLLEYHDKIKNGNFHLSSLENREEKVCKYCDFKAFCRVKEVFE